mgnify:CR=1 FL=1
MADLGRHKYLDHEFSQTSRFAWLNLHTIISKLTGAHPILYIGTCLKTNGCLPIFRIFGLALPAVLAQAAEEYCLRQTELLPSLQAILDLDELPSKQR